MLHSEGDRFLIVLCSVDMYVFDGPTPDMVTKQYQIGAIGLPVMQSYWAFGFHQCRWGYKNWSEVENVVNNYRRFDIPLETVWTGTQMHAIISKTLANAPRH